MKLKMLMFILLYVVFTSNIRAQVASEEQIDELFELQDINSSMSMLLDSIVALQKMNTALVPEDLYPGFWDKYSDEFKKDSFQRIKDLIVPIYKASLTFDEMKALLDFYKSEYGKSILEKLPAIQEASMNAGATLGGEVVNAVMVQIEEDKINMMQQEFEGCAELVHGNFISILHNLDTVFVERVGDVQYSYWGETVSKYDVEWLNECKYTLTLVETDNEVMASSLHKVFIANVYEVHQTEYKYLMSYEEDDLLVYGVFGIVDD